MSEYYIDQGGTKRWLNDKGQLHREDGPAYEDIYGYKAWYVNDKRHREDGPAIEYIGGGVTWWLDNKKYSQEEFNKLIKMKAFW